MLEQGVAAPLPVVPQRRRSDRSGSSSDGEAPEPLPVLRRSDSMTNLHYQPFVAAATALYIYERTQREPVAIQRHFSHTSNPDEPGPSGAAAVNDLGGLDDAFFNLLELQRPRSASHAGRGRAASTPMRERSSTLVSRSNVLVKAHKQSLEGSLDSLPGVGAPDANFDRPAATRDLETMHGMRRRRAYSNSELMDVARTARSPRNERGERTIDTWVSVEDAEAYVFEEAQPGFLETLSKLPTDRPVDVELEFHGSDGSCGASEDDALAEGCKGRLWTFSQTMGAAFSNYAAPGSTMTATAYYLKPMVEKTRKMPKKRLALIGVGSLGDIPTYYGYKKGVTQVLYGPDADPNTDRTRARSYALYKRVLGEWMK